MNISELMDPFAIKQIAVTGRELGRGAYGRVFEVIHCGTNFAVKEIHSILLGGGERSLMKMEKMFLRECYLLSRCLHPNIVQFIGIYYPINALPTLVMEIMECSLSQFIEQNSKPLNLNKALSMIQDVSLGLWYLHSRNPPVRHCDLSPHNILINTTLIVAKIADFGAAVEGIEGKLKVPGALHFMPPEALSQDPHYGLPSDVFSYGGVALCTVVEVWPVPTDKMQFDPKTRRRKILSEVERRKQYLDMMIGEAEKLRPLVEECLNDDPAVRPTMETLSERIKKLKKYLVSPPKSEAEKEEIIQQKDQQLQQKNQLLKHQEKEIQEKGQQLQQQNREMQQQHKQLREQDQQLRQQAQQLQEKDQQLQQKDQKLQQQREEIQQKDQQIQQLQENQRGDRSTWVVNRQEIRLSEKLLGTGGWGSVREGIFHGCKVAVKCIDNEIISPYNLRLFAREMDMAARCRHPNLLQFIAATNEGVPLIVTELMHTSLRKVLQQGQLHSNQIIPILFGAACGLNYLHKTTPNPILHRDISSANILLNPLADNQWHAKLSDFGSANFMRASHTVNPGNAAYAAPEVLKPEGPHTPAMDVFSFGVLMYEMCSREFPADKPNPSMLNNVKWDVTENRLVGMICSCLSHEIKGRPSMDSLIYGLNQ